MTSRIPKGDLVQTIDKKRGRNHDQCQEQEGTCNTYNHHI